MGDTRGSEAAEQWLLLIVAADLDEWVLEVSADTASSPQQLPPPFHPLLHHLSCTLVALLLVEEEGMAGSHLLTPLQCSAFRSEHRNALGADAVAQWPDDGHMVATSHQMQRLGECQASSRDGGTHFFHFL